ncbi:acyl--CoA ligase [Alphaproteobacteria bacterium]|nr:acyl--CoA ligase [Alphaproteobacteria bacterium]
MTDPLKPTGLVPDSFQTIADQLRENAARRGDASAMISVEDGKTLSWEDLYHLTTRVGHLMRSMGISANDRIAVLGENSIDNLILYYGIQAYGATYCTINVEVNRHHLLEMLQRIQPKAVFWQADLNADDLRTGDPGTWIDFGAYDGAGDGLFALLDSMPDHPSIDPVNDPEDRSVISFTSGTSAQPKGVLHCFSNYYAIAQHQRERWSLTEDDRVLEFRSFSWASAHMLSLNPVLVTGATLLFAKMFSRSKFLDWISYYRPTVIIAVPTVVNMLLESPPDDAKSAFNGVRFVSCSTAPLMPEQHRRFENVYGVPLVQLYGMSEGGVVAANYPNSRRIGSVGRPGLYHCITISGPNGETLKQGEIGEIETHSAQHAQAYLHADGEIEPIRGHALKTGDIGYLDEDGFLIVTGRARDVIIRGGVNIAPLEIDAVLTQHDAVAEAATFGVPDQIYGEEVASWITVMPDRSVTPDDLSRHCAAQLPDSKCPKHIQIVDEIPKNDRGKIDRNAVKAAWMKTVRADRENRAPPKNGKP